jgi:hypothetical protein
MHKTNTNGHRKYPECRQEWFQAKKLEAGPWLRCFDCGWNGARDYAAAIDIALLAVAFLKQSLLPCLSPRADRPTMTEKFPTRSRIAAPGWCYGCRQRPLEAA